MNQNTKSLVSDAPSYFLSQVFFLEQANKAADERPVMARIAISLSGERSCDNPITLDEITGLRWHNYQATLDLMHLTLNTNIQWDIIDLNMLHEWAKD